MSFALPFGVATALVTTWFFMSVLHGNGALSASSLGASVGSAATQSVAFLNDDVTLDMSGADSGVRDREWSGAVTDSSQPKADPAGNPFLDSTPIRIARRTPHLHHRAKHHQKTFHHHR